MTLYSKTISSKLSKQQQIHLHNKGHSANGASDSVVKATIGKMKKAKTGLTKPLHRRKTMTNDLLLPLASGTTSKCDMIQSTEKLSSLSIDVAKSVPLCRMLESQRRSILQRNTSKPKKTVHFATLATVTTVPRMEKEELLKCWYKSDEYKQFEQDRTLAVDAIRWALENSIYVNPTDGIALGLEHHISRSALYERKVRIYQHSHCVLKQQQYLKKMNGIVDGDGCETLRLVSELFSRGRIVPPEPDACITTTTTNAMKNTNANGKSFYFNKEIEMNTSPNVGTSSLSSYPSSKINLLE